MSWMAARQTLIAAHTAGSELYSLSEGHLMGKAFLPTVAALMDIDVQCMQCHLYCDNMAAVQFWSQLMIRHDRVWLWFNRAHQALHLRCLLYSC